ncbi:DUF2142 domain-containing protein [Leucobacter massiliensis]|uniref:DUF2142 domain-containing protein n=1 Tax=Leucobacter massiliensis TaxID=1686285 RepID=A0A2S9QKV5_9MICO|nr:DUF2142 domain-containing protein [Leucobacter massiliensis]PRI10212.1 hypothetical protein B4915_12435 [Leucobacter massiliensis]
MTSPKRILAVLGIVLAALVAFGAWALSSPVGATPDEDFHLASIWCGSGEREGLCGAGSVPENRAIPDKIAESICYAHEGDRSAACQGEGFLDSGFGLEDSRRVNSNGQYPTGYYFWTSFLASDNLAVSTLVMRFAHALLFTVLAVATWLLLPRANRVALLGAVAITFVPLGMFLIPSVNPSGWSIASGALLLPALLGYLTTTGRRSWALGGLAIVAALLGLGARGDSAAYAVVAVLAALVLAFRPTIEFLLRAILPLAIILASAFTFLTAGQTGLALDGMTQNGFEFLSPRILLFENVLDLPELYAGVFGQNFDSSDYTGLGWLDTPLPAAVWAPTTFVFAAVILTAIARFDWRRAVALLGVGLAAAAIPLYIHFQSHVPIGFQVQPRYVMPLLIVFAAVALSPSPDGHVRLLRLPRLTRVQWWIVAGLLSLANSVALFSNMRRYVSPGNFNLNDGDWWWRSAPPPMLVWLIGSLAFAALTVVLVGLLRRNGETERAAESVTVPQSVRSGAVA